MYCLEKIKDKGYTKDDLSIDDLSDEGKKFVIGTREGLFLETFPPERDLNKNERGNHSSDTIKMMHNEYSSLRTYLEELRKCQTTFFWSSITALGVLLSLNVNLVGGGTSQAAYVISLASLLLVCPIWSIWLLKASSITRVAGYLRVLEDMISGRDEKKYKYIGWENSYFVYRRSLLKSYEIRRKVEPIFKYIANVIRDSLKESWLAFCLVLKFEKPYQYNILTWVSFFFIALSYFLIAAFTFDSVKNPHMKYLSVLPFSSFIFTTLYTSGVLSALSINQSRSMATRERLWRYLLDKKMFLAGGKHFLIHEREEENESHDADERKLILSKIINYCNKKAEIEASQRIC